MTTIYLPNAVAESINGKYVAPVTDGLEYWHFFNTSQDKVKHNFAPGKVDPTPVGTITAQANYAEFKSLSNYLQTELIEPMEFTLIAVVKTPNVDFSTFADKPAFFGTFRALPLDGSSTSSLYGTTLFINDATTISLTATRKGTGDPTSAPANLTGINPNSWGLYVGRVSYTSTELKSHTLNITDLDDAGGLQRFRSKGKIKIGGVNDDFGGINHQAFQALYSRVLTDAEVALVVKRVRDYMFKRGIIV